MASVTQRINEIHQPYGGYLKPRNFQKRILNDQVTLFPEENIHASIIGLAVDYLTRFMMGDAVNEAFFISLAGAARIGESRKANKLAKNIKGLDENSIKCACKLAGYDVCVRAGINGYKPVDKINPDTNTIFNIRTMVERSIYFWKQYGPIVKSGFTLEGGYTDLVSAGDGDYITNDTLWDFKVSKAGPQTKHTLQLLMYYIMGLHSIHPEFQTITRLGIYNPRLNIVYTYNIADIDQSIIDQVSENVIGYSSKGTVTATGLHDDYNVNENFEETTWSVQNLIDRYGVGRAKITDDLIHYGLPYWKEGRSFRFNPDDVIVWEIHQRTISYRNRKIELPGYTQYGKYLKAELKQAKHNCDKERIRQIKKLIKENGYSSSFLNTILCVSFIAAVVMFAIVLLILRM